MTKNLLRGLFVFLFVGTSALSWAEASPAQLLRKLSLAIRGKAPEASEMIEEFSDNVRDAALISAAQRVEHYEMAGYGSVIAYARLLEESEAAEILEETLEEEMAADRKLTELSEDINEQANHDAEDSSNSEPVRGKRGAKRAA